VFSRLPKGKSIFDGIEKVQKLKLLFIIRRYGVLHVTPYFSEFTRLETYASYFAVHFSLDLRFLTQSSFIKP
jgi:hypothetical protein